MGSPQSNTKELISLSLIPDIGGLTRKHLKGKIYNESCSPFVLYNVEMMFWCVVLKGRIIIKKEAMFIMNSLYLKLSVKL